MNKLSTLALIGAASLASCTPADPYENVMVDAYNDGGVSGLGNTSDTEKAALGYIQAHKGEGANSRWQGGSMCHDVFDMVDGVRKNVDGISSTVVLC